MLITKPDLNDPESCKNLCGTLNELCRLKIIPVLNTNDAVAPPPVADQDLVGVLFIVYSLYNLQYIEFQPKTTKQSMTSI